MPSFNHCVLLGNATRTPESRFTPQGTQIVEFGLAVNRKLTVNGEKREEVSFFDIVLWAKLAEVAQKYLNKGDPVLIAGHLRQDTWTDKQSGQKRSKVLIVGETLQLLGPRATTTPDSAPPPQRQAAAPKPASPAPQSRPEPDPDLDAAPDDCPF